jgi:uncharacterized protein
MTALLDTVLETIRARRDEIEARYGIRLLGVVGSVARGEERADSDVDIAFSLSGSSTLFKLARAQFELEEALSRPVDLVDTEGMRREARDFITRDLVLA